jgi:YVTN family beta-propeller protein
VGFDAVWSMTCAKPGLARIDLASDEVTGIDIGPIADSESSVGAGQDAAWVVTGLGSRTLERIDPTTRMAVAHYPIEGNSTAVRVAFGAVWIADPVANLVYRFDPAQGTVVGTIAVGKKPQFLAVGAGAVWTMNQVDGTVTRIDPATNGVAAIIAVGEVIRGGDIVVGGGYVWLRGSDTLLFKIDPNTNQVVARYGPSSGSGSVAADDQAVWITAHDTRTIWRLPLR